jgi:hypothetical protein
LQTGGATLIGAIGVSNIHGITTSAVPEPAIWAMMLLGFGAVGRAMRRLRVPLPAAHPPAKHEKTVGADAPPLTRDNRPAYSIWPAQMGWVLAR